MAKKARPKLTAQQKKLLAYPPKQGSWICKNKTCGVTNPEKLALCWACGRHQGTRRKLAYPLYLEACLLDGREPAAETTIHDRRPING